MVYDSGLIVGRFQTFHKGHQSLVDAGLSLCDRILILIGSAQESGTERNPFNIATRIDVIRSVYEDNKRVSVYALPDLTHEDDLSPEWGRYLLDQVDRYIYKAPELMIYGNDEARSRWFDVEDIKDTAEFIIPRSRLPISATMLRDMMVRDERREWMKWVNPKLHKMYDRLRAELMEVPYYSTEESSIMGLSLICRCGGMADAADSNSVGRNIV